MMMMLMMMMVLMMARSRDGYDGDDGDIHNAAKDGTITKQILVAGGTGAG